MSSHQSSTRNTNPSVMSEGCVTSNQTYEDTRAYDHMHTYLFESDRTLVIQLFDITLINLFVCESE